MTLYAIFDAKPGKPRLPKVVPEGFSWFASLLPPVFLLLHGLWLEAIAFVLGVGALMVLSAYIGDTAALALYLLAAIGLGLAAAGLRRHALQWRGWTPRGMRVAASAELAQLEALR